MTEAHRTKSREHLLKQLTGLADEGERQKFLAHHRTLVRPEIISEIADKVRAGVGRCRRARRRAGAALAIAKQLEGKESLAKATRQSQYTRRAKMRRP